MRRNDAIQVRGSNPTDIRSREKSPDSMHRSTIDRRLLDRREQVLAFIRSKVSDPDLAEDILQDSLLRAIQASPNLRDDERLVPWFYRIVRNAITDTYRRSATRSKYLDQYVQEVETVVTPEDEAALCACLRELIPDLKDEYRDVIEEIDLKGNDHDQAAVRFGISRNNLKVRLHRARHQLRTRLEETCRTCAKHGCLDCTCGD